MTLHSLALSGNFPFKHSDAKISFCMNFCMKQAALLKLSGQSPLTKSVMVNSHTRQTHNRQRRWPCDKGLTFYWDYISFAFIAFLQGSKKVNAFSNSENRPSLCNRDICSWFILCTLMYDSTLRVWWYFKRFFKRFNILSSTTFRPPLPSTTGTIGLTHAEFGQLVG